MSSAIRSSIFIRVRRFAVKSSIIKSELGQGKTEFDWHRGFFGHFSFILETKIAIFPSFHLNFEFYSFNFDGFLRKLLQFSWVFHLIFTVYF